MSFGRESCIISGVENLQQTDLLQQGLLFQFVFKKREWRVQDLAYRLANCSLSVSLPRVIAICEQWAVRGLLVCTQNVKTPGSRMYRFVGKVDFSILRYLAVAGDSKGWWKGGDNWYSRDREALLRCLYVGGREIRKALDALKWDGSDQWEMASRFMVYAKDERPFPIAGFPRDAPDRIYRLLGALCLTGGAEFASLLADWRQHHARGAGFALAEDAVEYMAHCVLAGHSDWAQEVDVSGFELPVRSFKTTCAALAAGNLAEAFSASTPFIGFKFSSDRKAGREILFGLLATNLLVLLITAFHKPTPTRMKALVARLCPYSNGAWGQNFAPEGMEDCVAERIRVFQDCLVLCDLSWFDIASADHRLPASAVAAAVMSLASGLAREKVAAWADDLLAALEQAVRDHVPTLAGVILSVFGWAFDGERRARMEAAARAVTAAGGVWFRSFDAAGQVPWKRIVAALAERLPAQGKKTKEVTGVAKKGRIFWALRFYLQDAATRDSDAMAKILAAPAGSLFNCYSIEPYYRGPRGAENCSNDKPVTLRSVRSGKYDACLTEEDRTLLAAIEKERAEQAGPLPTPILELLTAMDNVLVKAFDAKNAHLILSPIALRRKTVPLTVTSREDGGVDLAVPAWSVDAQGDRRIVAEGNGVFAVIPLGKQVKGVLDVFREFGAKAKMSIPKDGMAEMRPLIGRLGGLFPIQGEMEAIGEGTGLERVAGETKPLVRLEFVEDELAIVLKVRPFPGAAELLFVPGAGQPERVVNAKGRTLVVVRDLAGERAQAQGVRAALQAYADWAVDASSWRIASLEEALGALIALKVLGEAVTMEWRGGEKLKVTALKPGGASWRVGDGAAERWFSVKGEFAFDDGQVLSVMRLVEAFAHRVGDFVAFGDGAYLKLTGELARRLEALAAAGQKAKGAIDVPPAALPLLARAFETEGEDLPGVLKARAAEWERAFAAPVDVPAQLKAQLRPYQEEGYVWLARLAACGFGACLADDMGLGKTVQTIALLLARAAEGASLVVAPASVCMNWRREIARFAPTLKVTMGWEWAPGEKVGARDVVVASYGILVSRAEAFQGVDWNGIVLDEAQAIKNEAAKRSKTVKELRAKFRVVATGTPVENRLEELWSLFEFLNPGLLGPLGAFLSRYTNEGRATPELKRLVAPFILRRLKRDVLADLPPKTEITIPVELDEAERTAYEGCRRHALEALAGKAAENRISILAELTRLRRFCCHPSLVLPDFTISAKLETLTLLLADLRSNAHRALVFSQFTDYLALVRRLLEDKGWTYRYLDGTTPQKDREAAVDAFQRGEGDFFLISLKAGGMGLNLTAANYVVLLDPWWNPAVENQAADRVHRIGQKDPVTVYRLIAADTVEERVLDLHAEKKEMAEDVLDGTSSTALTPEVLMSLFR